MGLGPNLRGSSTVFNGRFEIYPQAIALYLHDNSDHSIKMRLVKSHCRYLTFDGYKHAYHRQNQQHSQQQLKIQSSVGPFSESNPLVKLCVDTAPPASQKRRAPKARADRIEKNHGQLVTQCSGGTTQGNVGTRAWQPDPFWQSSQRITSPRKSGMRSLNSIAQQSDHKNTPAIAKPTRRKNVWSRRWTRKSPLGRRRLRVSEFLGIQMG